MQELVLVEIVDLLGPAVFLEIGGRCDHALGGFGELAGAQGAVFQLTDAHGHIETLADQLNVAVIEHHVHRDIGIFLQEFPQNGRKVIDPEIGGHGNPQKPRGRGLHGCHKRIRLARIIEHPARAIIVGKPDLRGAHAARGAI